MTDLFRIKPLEWERDRYGFQARVGDNTISVFLWPWRDEWMWTAGDKSCVTCASPEEGKQLAEQHWQEYIKQALVPVETEQWLK